MKLRTLIAALVIGAAGLGTGACSVMGSVPRQHTTAPTDTPCATEDSVACLWDAKAQGNGFGTSVYTDANGTTHLPTVKIPGGVDGHLNCRAFVGLTSVVVCADGYVSTS